MPVVAIEPTQVASADWWGEALDEGLQKGVEKGAEVVREAATEALETRTDPWGAAFAPLSPVTIKLYATIGERDYASLVDSLRLRRKEAYRVAVTVSGRPRAYAFRQQYGSENAQMFNNSRPVRVPARPLLPTRDPGSTDGPQEIADAIRAAIRQGVIEARDRHLAANIRDTQRTLRALRRR